MPEFLADNNNCGQTILQLVSRGNAIISEILRLKDFVPQEFRLIKQDVPIFSDIILDFSYFKIADAQDQKIENSKILRNLDDEFRDNYLDIINRFYNTFESIYTYINDLNHYVEELNEGSYIHQTLETVVLDMEGKQLLCEALYLCGCMLLMVDYHIEGIIRERLLVSYYRYTPQRDAHCCIDDVCKLLRDTSFNTKKPNNYPEDYFRRIPLNDNFIEVVIGKLRSDDIYNQLSIYPSSKHRSTALATQASMLYVCLFFSPAILHTQNAIMREIVDKYFPDNWVITIYMGFIINLVEYWEHFKAAKLALNNTVDIPNMKSISVQKSSNLFDLIKKSNVLLKEGLITKDNLLQNITKILNTLRECNITLRWLMLHAVLKSKKADKIKKCKQLRDIVLTESKVDLLNIFQLLLNTSQLELLTKNIFKSLLVEKNELWDELKLKSIENLSELSQIFGGVKQVSRVQKNASLQSWFLEISRQVETLEGNVEQSSIKIIQLIQALEDVQEFHQIEADMQVIQYLTETRKFLDKMLHVMKIKDDILITLQVIGDICYGWELIDTFTSIMQQGIRHEPTLVIKLRAVFLKMASALEIPLLRINQSHSEDLISVSQYYSHELEIYVRMVLQIIPKMMFEKMARIFEMQTSILKELPSRLEKDKLKEYAQLKERLEFAELTHSVSIFSQGMRMMKSTLVGVICLDPKVILEDGIRKELVQHISKALHNELIFSGKHVNELGEKLKNLGHIMDGYKRSFEYIQDYVNVNGLKIWQEEVTRIINYNVERECNRFIRNKIHDWDSSYQSRYVPIPNYNRNENFIGRLAKEILRLIDPRTTVYIEQTSTWYHLKTQKIVMNKEIINLIVSAIEITGLVGLDRLYSFMIIANLKTVAGNMEIAIKDDPNLEHIISGIKKELTNSTLSNIIKFYNNCTYKSTKQFGNVIDGILNIGVLQLMRNLIAFYLNTSCKFDAKYLESSLNSVNRSLLIEMTNGTNVISENESLFFKLSQYFDYAGLSNPNNKIYITTRSNEKYAIYIFICTICYLQKIYFYNCSSTRKLPEMDSASFIRGIHTLVKQFNCYINTEYISYMCQYILHNINYSIQQSKQSTENVIALQYMNDYSALCKDSGKYIQQLIPNEILHLYQIK